MHFVIMVTSFHIFMIHCLVIILSFYTMDTFLKKSCKSNTEFPFKTVYFLGGRGLTASSDIVYDYTTSRHMDL
jgi:hypothetical protein